jgi:hypothetical protein
MQHSAHTPTSVQSKLSGAAGNNELAVPKRVKDDGDRDEFIEGSKMLRVSPMQFFATACVNNLQGRGTRLRSNLFFGRDKPNQYKTLRQRQRKCRP